MEPEETYSPAEAAKILRVSKRQILNYLNAGELEGEQNPGNGRWRVDARSVHAMLEQRRDRIRSSEAAERPAEVRECLPYANRYSGSGRGRIGWSPSCKRPAGHGGLASFPDNFSFLSCRKSA
jgi:excisionase family DNA binding protein